MPQRDRFSRCTRHGKKKKKTHKKTFLETDWVDQKFVADGVLPAGGTGCDETGCDDML